MSCKRTGPRTPPDMPGRKARPVRAAPFRPIDTAFLTQIGARINRQPDWALDCG